MVNEGNDIILSKKGSYIKNVPSGKVIKMNLDQGTPQFDVWVNKEADNELPKAEAIQNMDNAGDVKDSDVSAFQRLEMFV